MCSTSMIILFVLAPSIAAQLTKPMFSSRVQLPSPGFGLQAARLAGGSHLRQRLPPAYGEFDGMTQDQIDFIKRKRGEMGFENVLDTHGRASPTGGAAAPAPAPSAYSAPAPPASGSDEFAGMTQDQIDFIRRKRGEIGMTGGLDTHGRPRLDAQEFPNLFGILAVGLLGCFISVAVTLVTFRFRRSASHSVSQPFLA